MPVARIKALTFDVTNTLIKARRSVGHQYADAARAHGIDADPTELENVFESTMAQKKREMPDYGKHHGVSSKEWWADVVQRVFVNAGHKDASQDALTKVSDTLWQHFQDDPSDAWEVLPNVKEGLESMKCRGLRLGVISNFDSTLQATLRAHGLNVFFDFTVASEDARISKPDPGIFHKGLDKFEQGRLAPNEVAHVGDEVENDFVAPRNLGMTAFLVDREGQLSSAVMKKVIDRRFVARDLKEVDTLVSDN